MRIDLYTKMILTLIALLLAVMAIKPMIHPTTTAYAQPPFTDIQFMGGGQLIAMDKQTGKVWVYAGDDEDHMAYMGRFVELGRPLVK